ncbi:hypothetical protein UFOVP991_37 [uncultured Caudovirales phage]|uniref:Head-tail adaptor protein n=1 Tax=uncultured Caudovirales phage TaxID=2100421 RepID=A0A6J7XL98_9CAUD|nr:hypothetical protein UFOVP991_37 [uncultured Caudovirales phage]CAB4183053.1 hypothetical protein UFOVP1076_37 [uncultured Caudovirales phage]CAB4197654.1 hypothetical protein UFOVP1314_20 [uncultured Caudovirales phage]CAB4211376.1 hypothetical protein UFOVP1427_51 [uncultured Caudovirales phage]CAB5238034.1 hypothetical protein UFOVP1523_55 [uncultured Caudovirales phage]
MPLRANKQRQNAEEFDPWSADIYGPTRLSRPSGVPGASAYVRLFTTRIKTPRGLYTTEMVNQQHDDARFDTVIEVSNAGTDAVRGSALTTDMYILHRDRRYDIVGPNNTTADWRKETTSYQCRSSANPVT